MLARSSILGGRRGFFPRPSPTHPSRALASLTSQQKNQQHQRRKQSTEPPVKRPFFNEKHQRPFATDASSPSDTGARAAENQSSCFPLDDELSNQVMERAKEDPIWAFKLYGKLIKNDAAFQAEGAPSANLASAYWKRADTVTPEEIFTHMDVDHDGDVQFEEFKKWFEAQRDMINATREAIAVKKRNLLDPDSDAGMVSEDVTSQQYSYLFLRKFVPFLGFGFTDVAIMLASAGALDVTVGVWFGLTTLAAAGLGNCASNFVGLWVVGLIEASANKLGIPDPKLSSKQRTLPRVHQVATLGTVLGMLAGCCAGLAPLFLLGHAFETDPLILEAKRNADEDFESQVHDLEKQAGMKTKQIPKKKEEPPLM